MLRAGRLARRRNGVRPTVAVRTRTVILLTTKQAVEAMVVSEREAQKTLAKPIRPGAAASCDLFVVASDASCWRTTLPMDLGPVCFLLVDGCENHLPQATLERSALRLAAAVLGCKRAQLTLRQHTLNDGGGGGGEDGAVPPHLTGLSLYGRAGCWRVPTSARPAAPAQPATTAATPPWGLVHVPRTGGTALEMAAFSKGVLWGYVRSTVHRHRHLNWHMPPSRAPKNLYPPLQRLFAVVRDPTTRAVSAYGYHCARKSLTPHPAGMNAFLHANLRLALQARQEGGPATVENQHFIPQVCLVKDPRRPVERVFRFETDLPAVINRFFRQQGLNVHLPAGRINASADAGGNGGGGGAAALEAALSPEVLGLLATVFADDYAAFGYPAPPTPAARGALPTPACDLASVTYVQGIEHSYLPEFVAWYQRHCGVQQVHFISTDRLPCPCPLASNAAVFWHYLEDDCYLPNGQPNGGRFYETPRLTAFINRELAHARWLLYVDSDEYLSLTTDGGSLLRHLQRHASRLEATGAITLRWYIFPIPDVHADRQLATVARSPVGTRHLTSTKYVGRPGAVRYWKPHVPDLAPGYRLRHAQEHVALLIHCAARCVEHVLLKQMYQCFNDSKRDDSCTADSPLGRLSECLSEPARTPFVGLPPRVCDMFYMLEMVRSRPLRLPPAHLDNVRRALARGVVPGVVPPLDFLALLPEGVDPAQAEACAATLALRRPLRQAPALSDRLTFLRMCAEGRLPQEVLTPDGQGRAPPLPPSTAAAGGHAQGRPAHKAVPKLVAAGRRRRGRRPLSALPAAPKTT